MKILEVTLRRYDMFSFILGTALMNFIWAIQPKYSEARLLIENGIWFNTFMMVGFIISIMLIGIIFYRIKEVKDGL